MFAVRKLHLRRLSMVYTTFPIRSCLVSWPLSLFVCAPFYVCHVIAYYITRAPPNPSPIWLGECCYPGAGFGFHDFSLLIAVNHGWYRTLARL
ncbi:hypothetical protein B0T26DRAFT_696338 [Lasiosphaeria miniovina]|uniref:Uncharacterized protein n=1 Tax=Lasiosphaeria miniovina TaxID=1954250 RepID=A0AA40B5I0_9PEZI|nr:uncharacterized protein B0T26DRAFT_696338 [Lasiosphaeria miniovina]KAK0727993.1 hypothetical protein B0T26DRAFT_696338 [Lasiosphaeria miniovina]